MEEKKRQELLKKVVLIGQTASGETQSLEAEVRGESPLL